MAGSRMFIITLRIIGSKFPEQFAIGFTIYHFCELTSLFKLLSYHNYNRYHKYHYSFFFFFFFFFLLLLLLLLLIIAMLQLFIYLTRKRINCWATIKDRLRVGGGYTVRVKLSTRHLCVIDIQPFTASLS